MQLRLYRSTTLSVSSFSITGDDAEANIPLVSVIWICNFVGFMIAGSTNVFITDRVGLGIVSLKRSALDLVRSSSNAACSS